MSTNKTMEPEVQVQLGGKERTLRFDFNAMALIEERTDRSLMEMGDWKKLKAKDLRSMIWACLVQTEPSVTETEVGRMLSVASMKDVMTQFARGMYIAMKGEMPPATLIPEDTESPLAEEPSNQGG